MDRHFYESINGGKPTCIDDDIPFEIPDSWEWVRLNSLGEIIGGGTPSTSIPAYWDGGIPWITPADMRNNRGKYISRGSKDISELGVAKSSTRVLPAGSVVFSSRAPIGYVAITENELYTNQGFKSVSFFTEGHQDFIYHALIGLTEDIKQRASGTTFAEISGSEFGTTLIPLPPKRESSRIVKEIESYYSALEKIQDSRARYKRILSETPTSLRQQLIQAAIQGRLVSQNPDDEPASVLLKRIAQERTAKLGKKAAKSMSRIVRRGSKTYELFPDGAEKDISDEIPFEIPSSWAWVRLGNLCIKIGAGSTPKGGKAVYKENGILFLRSQNVYNNGLRLEKVAFIEPAVDESMAGSRVEPLDLLLNITGASIGRCAIVPPEIRRANVNQHVLILRCIDKSMDGFVHACIVAPFTFKHIMSLQVGATKEGLSAQNASRLLLPIPPYAEQQRIVTTLNTALAYIAL